MFSAYYTFKFMSKWYRTLFGIWPPERGRAAKPIFGLLPVITLGVLAYTLRGLASFDVVDSGIYIIFYISIGFAWIYLCLMLMALFFDLSWADDALNLNNKAALFSISGGFLGLAIIYSGANIGDGPGWWCVFFAAGLGTSAWFLLGMIVNLFTGLFERITVERDIGCGIRTGFYLLASGIVLGRASAGNWTSFLMTIIEFADGWPVLAITVLAILIERFYIHKSKEKLDENSRGIIGSVSLGIAYVLFAVISVILLPPLP